MKTLICSLILTSSAFSQAVTYTAAGWTFPGLGGNASIPVVQTYDQSVALWNSYFMIQQLQGVAPTTLTANTLANATSFPVANITGLSVGNGVCISPSTTQCVSTATITGTGPYTFSATTVEVARITAITPGSGTTGTLTVSRAEVTTTGAQPAYSSGQVVTFMALPNLTYWAESFYVGKRAEITSNPLYGAPTAVAQAAAIAAANATNNNGSIIH